MKRPASGKHRIPLTPTQVANRAVGAFQLLTGRVYSHPCHEDGRGFDLDPSGFMGWLRYNGIAHFLQDFEPLRPHQPKHLPEGTLLLPPRPMETWPVMLLLCAIADMLRDAVGPVALRNIYRPGPGGLLWDGSEPGNVNKWVGGSPASDHIWACAADLDFNGRKMVTAKRVLKPILTANVNLLPSSVGWGKSFVHLGLWAPQTVKLGKCRRWSY